MNIHKLYSTSYKTVSYTKPKQLSITERAEQCSKQLLQSKTDEAVYRVTERRHKDTEHQFLHNSLYIGNCIITVVDKLGFLTEADSL